MTREDRAKQFAPFDALKGLQEALRVKEFQHEKVLKGEISEEMASELSKNLLSIESGDVVSVTYYTKGHEYVESGFAKILFDDYIIKVGDKKIQFDSIRKISIK